MDGKIVEWKNVKDLLKTVYFDEEALLGLKSKGSLTAGIVLVLLAILLQSSFSEKAFHWAFLWSLVNLFGAILAVYITIKILSSKSHFNFEQLLFGISLACVLGFIAMWLVIGIGYFLFGPAGYNFLLQVKQYYMMVMFSFSAEVFSELKGWKSVTVGLAGMTILLILSYLLG
ncbi:MAG: hypothetical protein AABX70_01325 [Nanoarchaeota archaeon]